jgi:Gluconate 2-dehydrogenase subunit 3
MAALPAAAPSLMAQQPAPSAARPVDDAKLEVATPDAATEPIVRFFHADQFSALRKLSDMLMPASPGKTPGALDAGAPEFLDFLIGQSAPVRQQLYRTGLDQLNRQARAKFAKTFADLDDAQADTLLAPLREPWTHEEPADPLARFLRAAKADVRTATTNSREYAAAGAASGRRAFGGGGSYWYPLD